MKKILALFSSIKLLLILSLLIVLSLLIGIISDVLQLNDVLKIIIDYTGLNNVPNTWWFRALLFLLALNTFSCTIINFISFVRSIKNTNIVSENHIKNLKNVVVFKKSIGINDLIKKIRKRGYLIVKNLYQRDSNQKLIYARKGILGKFGFFLLHLSIILIMLFFSLSALMEKSFLVDLNPGQHFKIPMSNYTLIIQDIYTTKDDLMETELEIQEDRKLLFQTIVPISKNIKLKPFYDVYCLYINVGVETVIERRNTKKENYNYILTESDHVLLENNKSFILDKIFLNDGIERGFLIVTVHKNGSIESQKRVGVGDTLTLDQYIINFRNIVGYVRLRLVFNPVSTYIFISFILFIFGLLLSLYIPFNELFILVSNDCIIIAGRTNKMERQFEKEIKNIKMEIEGESDD